MRSYSRSVQVPQPGPRHKFVSPKHQDWVTYVILGRCIWVSETHWIGRSVPCVRADGPCPNCKPGGRPRYTGYIHTLTANLLDDAFLVLPHGTVYRLQQSYGEHFNFRGRRMKLRRAGKGQTAPLHAEVDVNSHFSGELKRELEPNAFLEKIFARVLHLTEPPDAA